VILPRRATVAHAAVLVILLAAAFASPLFAQSRAVPPAGGCGELVSVETHGRSRTRYALAHPKATASGQPVLMLLAGGGGHLDLDDNGCPRALTANFLVRSLALFHGTGFATALVDAPSDHPGEDGLKGFRITSQHADDLGKVIADLRKRSSSPLWVVGTSRGTISAANVAARPAGPDGLVLTSAVTSGAKGGMRPWATQTVFDLGLEAITAPVLVVGHAGDNCPRTPASLMSSITARTNGAREQVVAVTGGSGGAPTGLEACGARTPHGFLGQEAAVVAGIGRFIRGGRY